MKTPVILLLAASATVMLPADTLARGRSGGGGGGGGGRHSYTHYADSTPSRNYGNRSAGAGGGTPTADSTCYTGPRGGTYTITPSGNKNYRGC
jgi:hypothetical protein